MRPCVVFGQHGRRQRQPLLEVGRLLVDQRVEDDVVVASSGRLVERNRPCGKFDGGVLAEDDQPRLVFGGFFRGGAGHEFQGWVVEFVADRIGDVDRVDDREDRRWCARPAARPAESRTAPPGAGAVPAPQANAPAPARHNPAKCIHQIQTVAASEHERPRPREQQTCARIRETSRPRRRERETPPAAAPPAPQPLLRRRKEAEQNPFQNGNGLIHDIPSYSPFIEQFRMSTEKLLTRMTPMPQKIAIRRDIAHVFASFRLLRDRRCHLSTSEGWRGFISQMLQNRNSTRRRLPVSAT